MFKYYQELSLVALNHSSCYAVPLLLQIYCPHSNLLFILYKYVYYPGHQSHRHVTVFYQFELIQLAFAVCAVELIKVDVHFVK